LVLEESTVSPWRVVLSLIERFEDALVVTWAFEYRDENLLANGRTMAEVLDGFPSERGVASLLADRMVALDGGTWIDTDFYRPTRGNLDPTDDEVRTFVKRCSDAGVRLHYDDDTEVGGRTELPAS
jgi:hypothetical protein